MHWYLSKRPHPPSIQVLALPSEATLFALWPLAKRWELQSSIFSTRGCKHSVLLSGWSIKLLSFLRSKDEKRPSKSVKYFDPEVLTVLVNLIIWIISDLTAEFCCCLLAWLSPQPNSDYTISSASDWGELKLSLSQKVGKCVKRNSSSAGELTVVTVEPWKKQKKNSSFAFFKLRSVWWN